MSNTHHYQLDFIKVIAIIGVVYLHLSDNYLRRPDFLLVVFYGLCFLPYQFARA